MSEETKICFVCLGNIVRSPLAEHLFRYLANKAGVGKRFEVSSAGTDSWHIGEEPDRRMRRIAASHGIEYSGRARKLKKEDLTYYDWIIVMDSTNKKTLLRLVENQDQIKKIHLLREFDPLGTANASVPDPYYGGIEEFEEVFQIIKRSCQGLLGVLGNNYHGS